MSLTWFSIFVLFQTPLIMFACYTNCCLYGIGVENVSELDVHV